jgi:YHS domain-containing protein
LSSGIDLALRVVERYFGRATAERTAFDMEYQGRGWSDPGSNAAYAHPRASGGNALCAVCGMEVDPETAPHAVHDGKTYYFCSQFDRNAFAREPARYVRP